MPHPTGSKYYPLSIIGIHPYAIAASVLRLLPTLRRRPALGLALAQVWPFDPHPGPSAHWTVSTAVLIAVVEVTHTREVLRGAIPKALGASLSHGQGLVELDALGARAAVEPLRWQVVLVGVERLRGGWVALVGWSKARGALTATSSTLSAHPRIQCCNCPCADTATVRRRACNSISFAEAH